MHATLATRTDPSMLQALTAIQKAGPAEFMSRPAVLATHLSLLEAAEDLQGARSLAQSSLQAADQSKGHSASTKAVLYETLARVQLKVIPCYLSIILAFLPHSSRCNSCEAVPSMPTALHLMR